MAPRNEESTTREQPDSNKDEPQPKRQRTSSTGTVSPEPVRSSTVDTAQSNNNTANSQPVPVDDVLSLLRELQKCNKVEDASECIKYIKSIEDMTKDQKRVIAKEICDYGLSTLIFALERFPQEPNFVKRIMILLKRLASREGHTRRQLFLSLGTVDAIVKTLGNFPEDSHEPSIRLLKLNAMWVFVNLSKNGDAGDAVFEDECVEFVVETMKRYDMDYNSQASGAEYFQELCKFSDRKEYLIEKEVDVLLAKAYHVLRKSDHPNRKICYEKSAKAAVKQLYT